MNKRVIVLVPIGAVPAELLHNLVAPLSATFGLPCGIATPVSIPPEIYDQRRRQYIGHGVLTLLAGLDIANAERVLGIIDEDCYTPGLNFVFGQASTYGRDAFIALPRLRQSYYDLPDDEALFRERAVKEAVHELGHTYGLDHCAKPECVMHFSNSLYDTDVKGAEFCSRCRTQLEELIKAT